MELGGVHMLKLAYLGLAAFAGAITSLAFMKWKEMSWGQILFTVFVGASFALFVTPLAAHEIFSIEIGDARTVAGLTYIMAAGSHIFLPLAFEWAKRRAGLRNGEEKA